MARTITIDVEVDIDPERFDDEHLIQELEERGYVVQKLGNGILPDIDTAYMAVRSNEAIPMPVREFILAAANRIN